MPGAHERNFSYAGRDLVLNGGPHENERRRARTTVALSALSRGWEPFLRSYRQACLLVDRERRPRRIKVVEDYPMGSLSYSPNQNITCPDGNFLRHPAVWTSARFNDLLLSNASSTIAKDKSNYREKEEGLLHINRSFV
jgi:hypothetical protein